MLQAGKTLLAVLFTAGTLFASMQPSSRAFAAEDKQSQTHVNSLPQGQSSAVPDRCSASKIPLTNVAALLPDVSISSFAVNTRLVSGMRSTEYSLVRKDRAKYASAKTVTEEPLIASDSAVLPAAQPLIVNTEVKGEAVEPEASELNADVLLNLVNQHRISIGIPALEKDESLMQLARERAPELFDEIFVNGNMHAGFRIRAAALPYYATENIIYNHTEEGAFAWWMGSGIHRSAIQNPEHTHTGIACSGLTCAQIFTKFQTK